MVIISVGTGDFDVIVGCKDQEQQGTLTIRRVCDIAYYDQDPDSCRNRSGVLQYRLILSPVAIQRPGERELTDLVAPVLIRMDEGSIAKIYPHRAAQPQLVAQLKRAPNPYTYICFEPSIPVPTKAFDPVTIYRPDARNGDWFCGAWTEADALGCTPIAIAHGFINQEFLRDPKRNVGHYHKDSLEALLPLYGSGVTAFRSVIDTGIQKEYRLTEPKVCDMSHAEIGVSKCMQWGVGEFLLMAPGIGHRHISTVGTPYFEQVTLKWPEIPDGTKDKVAMPDLDSVKISNWPSH